MTKNLERKKKEQIEGRTNSGRPIFNPTTQLVVVNLYTKFEVSILNGCGDIFDEKSGKKEKGTNTRKSYRRRPIFNATIQLVVVNPYTKFEVSILNGCLKDIFDEKVLRNYGRMDGTTDRCKPVYPQLFQSGGIINFYETNLWCYIS